MLPWGSVASATGVASAAPFGPISGLAICCSCEACGMLPPAVPFIPPSLHGFCGLFDPRPAALASAGRHRGKSGEAGRLTAGRAHGAAGRAPERGHGSLPTPPAATRPARVAVRLYLASRPASAEVAAEASGARQFVGDDRH